MRRTTSFIEIDGGKCRPRRKSYSRHGLRKKFATVEL
jgi:hypothetical protein